MARQLNSGAALAALNTGCSVFQILVTLKPMLAAIRIETVLAIVVVLNLIGLTIAAYQILRKK